MGWFDNLPEKIFLQAFVRRYKNLSGPSKNRQQMFFQTILLTALTLLSYGRESLSWVGRCQRRTRRLTDTVYVRTNTVEGLLTARLMHEQNVASSIVLVEEEGVDDDILGIEDGEKELYAHVLDACGLDDIDWVVATPTETPDDQAAGFSSTIWTSLPTKTEATSTSELWLPECGWSAIKDRLRDGLMQEDSMPGFIVRQVADVREEDGQTYRALDIDVLFDLCHILPLERQVLGTEYILRDMAKNR